MKRKFIITVYLIIAIVTFGHAWTKQNWTTDLNGDKIYCPNDLRGVGSFLSAMAWPFYWSTELWQESPRGG